MYFKKGIDVTILLYLLTTHIVQAQTKYYYQIKLITNLNL